MDKREEEPPLAMFKKPDLSTYRLMNEPSLQASCWFEIRLFYVRIAPCAVEGVPDHLTLRHPRREIGVSLEINGARMASSEATFLTLRRDRLDKESSEVTYVSTDSVKVTGAVEFEVYEKEEEMILCGSVVRMEAAWSNGSVGGSENDSKTGWSMDCYTAASIATVESAFFKPKFGISAPSFEVYIAGCCSGVPVILTKTIQISPRRKPRYSMLDAIPEDKEIGKQHKINNCLALNQKVQSSAGSGEVGFQQQCVSPGFPFRGYPQITEAEDDDYELDGKIGSSYYSEDMYTGEDGQLSWFNAGVRVGVGIGLGMCIGVGIGVGLLMRSYQATTSSFRRRFF